LFPVDVESGRSAVDRENASRIGALDCLQFSLTFRYLWSAHHVQRSALLELPVSASRRVSMSPRHLLCVAACLAADEPKTQVFPRSSFVRGDALVDSRPADLVAALYRGAGNEVLPHCSRRNDEQVSVRGDGEI
jgi:hypothetical protein